MSALASVPNQPEQGNEVPPEIVKRVEAMAKDRARLEPVFKSNRANAAGHQWLKYSRADRRLVLDPRDVEGGRERTTVNLLSQYLNAALGQLEGADERKDLQFRREDLPSEDFAKASNDATAFGWEAEWEASRQLARVKRRIVVDGTAAIRCYFDPTVGRDLGQVPVGDGQPIVRLAMDNAGQASQEMIPTAQGKPITDAEHARAYVAQRQSSGQRVQFKQMKEGRIRWRPGSVFNTLVPPGIEDEDEFPYEAWEEAVAIDTLLALYGSKAQGLQAESLSATETLGSREQLGDSLGSEDISQAPGKLEGYAKVITYFERPTRDHPKGRVVTYAGKKLLNEQGQLPYKTPSGEYHSGIVYFHWNRVEGRFFGIGLVEPGKKIQRLYNRACQEEQVIAECSKPYVIAAEGVEVEVPRVSMQVVKYKTGTSVPQAVPGIGPPNWLAAYKESLREDLERAMGLHGVTLGEAANAQTPYASVALQADQDAKKIGETRDGFQRGVDRLLELSIYDVRRYWPRDKMMALAGEEDMAEAVEFEAQKLPEFFLLSQAPGAAKPRSSGAEIQLITETYADSINENKPLPLKWKVDSIKAGKMLPLPEETADVHERKARWQNSQLSQHNPVEPADYDVIAVHIPIHRELQIEAEMADDMELLRAVTDHIAADEQIAQVQIEQQVAASQSQLPTAGVQPPQPVPTSPDAATAAPAQ